MRSLTVTRSFIAYAVLALFAMVALAPLLLVLINSFKSNAQILANPFSLPVRFGLENFVTAWQYGNFALGFGNSAAVTATAIVVALLASSLAGYVLATRRVRTWPAIMAYLTMAFTVPIQLFIFPLYAIVSAVGLVDNTVVVGVVLAAINIPFATLLMRTFFLGIPTEIEEAATVDGASTFQLFTMILLPLIRPGLITVGFIVGLSAWNEFLISSTFLQDPTTQTVTLGFLSMNGTFSNEIGTMLAGALLLIVPVLAIFLVLQRQVVDGMASGALK